MRDGRLAGLRVRSPVHGLERRTLGAPEVLAQSVSCAAPAAAMVTVPAIVAATAGPATVWSFAVATVIALLVATCIGRFTRRMAVAGSLYTLTAKGLGPGPAFASAGALLVGYTLLVAAAVTGAAIYLDALLARLGLPVAGAPGTLAGLAAVVAASAGVLVLLGVRLSARIVLLVEALSITLIVVVFGAVLVGGPVGSGPAGPPSGITGVAAGVLPALAAFIGFEAATALGVEARRPYRTVPRAVLATAAVAGVLYLLAASAQVSALGAGAGAPDPVIATVLTRGAAAPAIALDLGIAASFLACTVATANALVRVLFSLGRDRVAPRVLGATHPRYRTPHVAIAVAVPVAGVVPAALLAAGAAPGWALSVLLSIAAAGYLVAYLLVCLAAPVFLHRIGELTVAPVVATAVAAPVLVAVCAAYLVSATGGPVPVVLGVLAVAIAAWYAWLRMRRPAQLRGMGVYDETSAADVHGAWWR